MSNEGKKPSIVFRPSKPIIIEAAKLEAAKEKVPTENQLAKEDEDNHHHNHAGIEEEPQQQTAKRKREKANEKESPPEKAIALLSDTKPQSSKPSLSTVKETISVQSTKRTFGAGFISATFGDLAAKPTTTSVFDTLAEQPKLDNSLPIKRTEPDVQLSQADVVTGEEEDVTVFKARVTLRMFDAESREWKQRGQGPMHLNITSKDGTKRPRVIVRNTGTLGLLLNAFLFPLTPIEKAGEKSVRIVVISAETKKPVNYGLQFESKNIAENALETLKQFASNPEGSCRHLQEFGTEKISENERSSETNVSDDGNITEGEGEFDEYNP